MRASDQLLLKQELPKGLWYIKRGRLAIGKRANLVTLLECTQRLLRLRVEGHGELRLSVEHCRIQELCADKNHFLEIRDQGGIILELRKCFPQQLKQLSLERELPDNVIDLLAFANKRKQKSRAQKF